MVTVRPSEAQVTQKSIPLPDKPVAEMHLSLITPSSNALKELLLSIYTDEGF